MTISEIPIGFEGSWIGKDVVFEHFDSLTEFRAGTLVCDESSEIVVFEGNCGESDTDGSGGDFWNVLLEDSRFWGWEAD